MIFIAGNRDISQAVKVWRWNINGFGYSENGVDGPYTTAITADGSIVAAIITANMIRTGLLQSLNGESWLDLDSGAFSMGNGALKWDAVNGFESLSAKQITKPGSTTYGVIGDFVDENDMHYWEGFKLVSSQGDFFRITSPYTGSFLIYNGRYPVLISYPDSGSVRLIRKKAIDVVKGDADKTTLQFQDENTSSINARVICDSDGVRFEKKNGLPHGKTDKVSILTPDGTKCQHFINGIFVGITDF